MNASLGREVVFEATLENRQYRLTLRDGRPVMLRRLHIPRVSGRMGAEVWQRIWPVNGPHGGRAGEKVAPVLAALLALKK